MSTPTLWTVLGIGPTQDVTLIRRAYATLLKRIDAEKDPAGFAALRQAYEQAMMLARSAGAPAPGLAPAPVAAPVAAAEEPLPSHGPRDPVQATGDAAMANSVAPAPAGPIALDQLRADFVALQKAATTSQTPNSDDLRALLEACLTSPALENLTVQLEFEPAMVRFFAQTLPRTQSLLETVIERWKWRDRPRSVAGGGVGTLVAHADNLRRLEQLQYSEPRVYRALTRPPQPVWLWIQLVCLRLDNSVQAALEAFRNVVPGTFDARAQEWWSRYFTQPHIRPEWIRVAGFLAVLGLLEGASKAQIFGPRLWVNSAVGFLIGGVGGLVLAGLWFALVDWPRHRFNKSRRRLSPWQRLGWAPIAFAACILVAIFGDNSVQSTFGAVIVSVMLLAWIILLVPAWRDSSRSPELLRVWAGVVVNVPLGVWWVLMNNGLWTPPTLAMSIEFVATLLAFAFGQSVLWVEVLRNTTRSQRQQARAAFAAVALGAMTLLLCTRLGLEGNHLLLMCLVLIVLGHRTLAVNLTAEQVKIRHYVTLIPAVILPGMFSREDLLSVLQIGGILFMSGVALSMGVCLYNDWRAAREGDSSLA
jgi:hypothetical protein